MMSTFIDNILESDKKEDCVRVLPLCIKISTFSIKWVGVFQVLNGIEANLWNKGKSYLALITSVKQLLGNWNRITVVKWRILKIITCQQFTRLFLTIN